MLTKAQLGLPLLAISRLQGRAITPPQSGRKGILTAPKNIGTGQDFDVHLWKQPYVESCILYHTRHPVPLSFSVLQDLLSLFQRSQSSGHCLRAALEPSIYKLSVSVGWALGQIREGSGEPYKAVQSPRQDLCAHRSGHARSPLIRWNFLRQKTQSCQLT